MYADNTTLLIPTSKKENPKFKIRLAVTEDKPSVEVGLEWTMTKYQQYFYHEHH